MEQQQFGEPREEGLFEESINLRHYWHIILERRWLVAATFAVVMVLCLFYLFTATSIFSATTRLQIDNETENSMRMESFVMEGMQGQDYLQTQYKNLQSRSLMALALAEAEAAGKRGEVPVGAVIVKEDMVIASARNQKVGISVMSSNAWAMTYGAGLML